MSAEGEKPPVGITSPESEGYGKEQGPATPTHDSDVKLDINLSEEELAITDIFKPLPPLEGVPAEPHPLTMRAVLVGVVLGSLVNASNVYLGEFGRHPSPP